MSTSQEKKTKNVQGRGTHLLAYQRKKRSASRLRVQDLKKENTHMEKHREYDCDRGYYIVK